VWRERAALRYIPRAMPPMAAVAAAALATQLRNDGWYLYDEVRARTRNALKGLLSLSALEGGRKAETTSSQPAASGGAMATLGCVVSGTGSDGGTSRLHQADPRAASVA